MLNGLTKERSFGVPVRHVKEEEQQKEHASNARDEGVLGVEEQAKGFMFVQVVMVADTSGLRRWTDEMQGVQY